VNIIFEDEMPKMKTKSSAKKRFKITANGGVKASQANKQHNMRKRSTRQVREQRGTTMLPDMEAKRAKQFLPYGTA
jgi:large subunit ribosomal protein L35